MRRRPPNPWLSIPASDYEGHMGSPGVAQLDFLGGVFGDLLSEFEPSSLIILGCATGNGLERVEAGRVSRIIALDINKEYVNVCRERFAAKLRGLEPVCADIASFELEPESLDCILAALFLEYVDPALVVEKASRWLKRRGILAVVLQLPDEVHGKVSESRYVSLRRLEPAMRLVDPARFTGLVRRHGFSEVRSEPATLESGKQFYIGVYRLEAPGA
jgi:SAM-dependent methyltransferase